MGDPETYLKTQQVADALGVSVEHDQAMGGCGGDRSDPDHGQASAGPALERPASSPGGRSSPVGDLLALVGTGLGAAIDERTRARS